jgi:hypothetical protein
MADISHFIGSDLSILSNGNFELATDAVEGQQRVLRRLLTNPGDYPWRLEYGAGLAAFLGQTISKFRINARITSQMLLERAVLQNPPPTVDVEVIENTVIANIHYVDRDSGDTSNLEFNTGG